MEIESVTNEAGRYQLVFREFFSGGTVTDITVIFVEHWNLTGGINENMGFYIPQWVTKPFPYDLKATLLSIPIHIPDLRGRYIFKTCFEYFAKVTSLPGHVTSADHPGYPLMIVTFDSYVITEDLIKRIVEAILKGIQEAMIETKEIQSIDEKVEEDPLDDIDEAIVIEYEESDDLKELAALNSKSQTVYRLGDVFDGVSESLEEKEDEDD